MNTTDLKPIQTRYGGYNFRSRLEARWAVFFDVHEWPWEYEPEGFQLPSGWYLPDFRVLLPQMCGCCHYEPNLEWVEVKGQHPTAREFKLAAELAEASVMQVTILGRIPRQGQVELAWQARGPKHYYSSSPSGPSRGVHDMRRHIRRIQSDPYTAAALSARFEHGESGRT